MVKLASFSLSESAMSAARLALGFALAISTTACDTGSVDGTPDPGGPDAGAPADPTEIDVSGSVSESANWSGTIHLVGSATIEAGATINVAPDSRFYGTEGATLTVAGSLQFNGTAEQPIIVQAETDSPRWNGFDVAAGGSLALRHTSGTTVSTLIKCQAGALECAIVDSNYTTISKAVDCRGPCTIERSRIVDMLNGGLSLYGGGSLTITDSYALTSSHDIIVMSGGSLVVDYSEIGDAQGSYEHCNLHIGSSGSVTVTNSNIISSVYGIMIGNSDGARFSNNNFMDNGRGNDVLDLGGNGAVDMTGNYWDQGAPTLGGGFNTGSPAASPIANAGPR